MSGVASWNDFKNIYPYNNNQQIKSGAIEKAIAQEIITAEQDAVLIQLPCEITLEDGTKTTTARFRIPRVSDLREIQKAGNNAEKQADVMTMIIARRCQTKIADINNLPAHLGQLFDELIAFFLT